MRKQYLQSTKLIISAYPVSFLSIPLLTHIVGEKSRVPEHRKYSTKII